MVTKGQRVLKSRAARWVSLQWPSSTPTPPHKSGSSRWQPTPDAAASVLGWPTHIHAHMPYRLVLHSVGLAVLGKACSVLRLCPLASQSGRSGARSCKAVLYPWLLRPLVWSVPVWRMPSVSSRDGPGAAVACVGHRSCGRRIRVGALERSEKKTPAFYGRGVNVPKDAGVFSNRCL
jgi:hypothetical protein